MACKNAPKLSVILPYLSRSSCIKECLELLKANTASDYEVCSVVDTAGAYEAYNAAAAKATGEILVFLNDDMFVSPGWDLPMVESAGEKTVVTGYLVESGRLPVNHRNLCHNFGMDAAGFDGTGFFAFAAQYAGSLPALRPGLGWYMPFAIRREDFVPFPTTPETPNDSILFGIFASRGYRFLRSNSVVYHLQKMSES